MSIVGIAVRKAGRNSLESPPSPAAPGRGPSGSRIAGLCVGIGLFVLCFLPDRGRLVFDTQLVLPVNPASFLARGLYLWDDKTGFGELSDQAYGYLFPMGPFFLLCHAIAIPAWIAQRTWMGLLLVAGFGGTVRLARVLDVGRPASRIIGAAACALSPLIVTELGSISVATIAQLLLPWALIPLVTAFRPDGPSPLRAAAQSGLAILLMGGTNAFVTFVALPLPALWILTRASGPLKRRVGVSWIGAVAAATLWWGIPLLVFAKYSPRFILYIESAANTTESTSFFDALRGSSDWISYIPSSGGPWQKAGYELAASPILIAATAAVAMLGLAGLAHRDMPHRRFLVVALVTGVVLITFAHVGSLTPSWAPFGRTLLDGPLAPFRNIHRFDAVFRIALALGIVHLLSVVPATIVTGVGGQARDITRWSTGKAAHGAVALLVVLAAAPMFQGRLLNRGTYPAIPTWWNQTAGYLSANAQGTQALLLPASGFGEYGWGRTVDEPLAVLGTTPWAVRTQVPFAPVGNVLMMDAVQQAVAAGRASAGLADYLARSGVGFLVVRNDLDWKSAKTLRPSVVHATLDASPGLSRVAAFGPPSGGRPPESDPSFDTGLEPNYPAVEIYRVDRPVGQATAYPTAGALRVSGGPDSVLALIDAGLLDSGTGTTSGGEPTGAVTGARSAVTDGLRRQEINFGSPTDHSSATLSATDPWRLKRSANSYDLYPGTGDQTVAAYIGAKDIRASSSGSDVTAVSLPGVEHLPYAAFDAALRSFWNSANAGSPVGQWLELDLDHPVSAQSITVKFLNSALTGGAVKSVEVATDTGRITVDVPRSDSSQTVVLPPGLTTHIRLTATEAWGSGPFAIADVAVPGVSVQRTLVAPSPLPGANASGAGALGAVYAFTRSESDTGCVVVEAAPVCSPWLARAGEENGALDRTFTVGAAAERLTLTGTVRPTPGKAFDAMLHDTGGVTVTATSQSVADPRVRPSLVVHPDPSTPWIADVLDPEPAITMSWSGKRKLAELDVTAASPIVASAPRTVRIESAAGVRDLSIPDDGIVKFPALTTDRVTISFPEVRILTAAVPGVLGRVTLAVGVAGLRFPALDGIVQRVDPKSLLKTVCGDGPAVTVDGGAAISTRVVGTVGDAIAGRPLTFEPCANGGKSVPPLDLTAGPHRIRVTDSAAFSAAALDLVPGDLWTSRGATPQASRETSVAAWTSAHKDVRIAAGDQSMLVIHQNTNPGWQAELNGHRLRAVTVDGWQQGWIVPAGEGGVVRITYPPDTIYRSGIVVGAAAAVGLVVIGLLPGRRRRPAPNAAAPGDPEELEDPEEPTGQDVLDEAPGSPAEPEFVQASELATATDPADEKADEPSESRDSGAPRELALRAPAGALEARAESGLPAKRLGAPPEAAAVPLLAGFVLLAGAWALIPFVAARLLGRRPTWAPAAAALAYGAAGLTVAIRTHLGSGNLALADSVLIQGLCLAALGFTASGLVRPIRWKRQRHDI